MPPLAEAPLQQDIEDADQGKEKKRECFLSEYMKAETLILGGFIITFIFIVVVCVLFGPERVLRACLDFMIPPSPGWEHAVVLASLIAFLMIIPFPVVFIVMLLAGLNFGFWYGFVIILVPQPIGLSVAFIIGRNICQETIRNCMLGGNCPRAQAAVETLEAQKDLYVPLILFRFLPVPFAIRNYTPAMLNVPFHQLLLTSLPHCFWQAVLFASLGAMLKDTAQIARTQGRLDWESIRWQEALIFLGSVIGGIGCLIYATRLYYQSTTDVANSEGTSAGAGGDTEEPDAICCCCDRKTCCTPSLRCGLCWGYFLFILILGIIVGICIWKYGANAVTMSIIRALPENPDWKTGTILVLAIVVSQVLVIPGRGILSLLVGLLFGIWPGIAYLFVAFFLVIMICVAIGRAMGKPAVQECIQQQGWIDFRRFINIIEDDKHSMRLLALFPFLFQPDFARYYAPSVLAIPLWKFAVCCLPWCIWIALILSSLGASFQDSVALSRRNDEVSFSELKWQQVAVPLIAVFVTPLVIWYACREYRSRIAEEQSRPIRQS